ncbi:MAG: AAA family ATPase [Cyanobacteria bacterium]|nr:AAA family ATPase [Cyanobacteriota bacterium]
MEIIPKFIKRHIISFYSVQGGAGKTSLAFNFAWLLKNISNIKILLLDLNFSEGPSDLQISLNLPALPNLSVFMDLVSESSEALRASIISPEGLNMDILQPPLSVSQSDKFNIDMLNCLIYTAGNIYNFVIVDVPCRYDNISLEMLNLSTITVVVMDSVSRAAICRLENLQKFLPGYQQKILIINKIPGGQLKPRNDIRYGAGYNCCQKIPFIEENELKYLKNGRRRINIIDLQTQIANLACQVF